MKLEEGKYVECWFDIERKNQDLEVSLAFQNSWRVTIWDIKNGEIDCDGNYHEADGENKFTDFKTALEKARVEAKKLRGLGYITFVSSSSSKAKFKIKTIREELLMSSLPLYPNKDYRLAYKIQI